MLAKKNTILGAANGQLVATEEVLPKRARAEPLWFSQSVLAVRGLINLGTMRSTFIISNPDQNHAVLHCKVLAEHYNVLL